MLDLTLNNVFYGLATVFQGVNDLCFQRHSNLLILVLCANNKISTTFGEFQPIAFQ